MKKLVPGRICGLYLILMSSLFLLAFSPAGYLNIVETKYAVFCVLTALFFLCFLILGGGKKLGGGKRDIVSILILAYWSWSLLSALCSPWKRTSFLGGDRLDGMLTITLYCIVVLILGKCGEYGCFPYWIPAAGLTVLCAVAILQLFDLNPLWLYPDPLRWSGREAEYNGAFLSLTGNADLTASVLAVGFAFLWPSALRKKCWFCLFSSLLCLVVLIFSGIRAGLLGACASVILCFPAALSLSGKGKRRFWIIVALTCLGVCLLIYLVPFSGSFGELHELLHGHAEDSFGSGRIYIWKQVWTLVRERPLLGGGPDTLGQRGLAFVKVGADGAMLRRGIDCAHSEPLNILVNQGIPALMFLAAAIALTLLRAVKCGTSAVIALTSALTAYIVTSFFSIGMCANAAYFWLIWGSLLNETSKYNGNQRFNVI